MNTKLFVEPENVEDDVELTVEELEVVIAPVTGTFTGPVSVTGTFTGPLRNHSETLVEAVELTVENLEEVIAPQGIIKNGR